MELADYSQAFLAFAFVLTLIWAASAAIKRFGIDQKLRGISGSQGRLRMLDVLYLDARRKIALVRADNREYMILLTQDSVTVIDKQDVPNDPVA